MKHVFYFTMATLLVAIIIMGCEKDKEQETQLSITGQLVSHTLCKNDLKASQLLTETPDSLSCVEYSFDKEKNKLSLKHINAGFNCCPDSLYCNIELIGDTIFIEEFEKAALCNCNCLYDLDIEINGVDLKKYQIKFIEPYISDQDELIFQVDLKEESNGSYCVTRKKYPWGVYSPNN